MIIQRAVIGAVIQQGLLIHHALMLPAMSALWEDRILFGQAIHLHQPRQIVTKICGFIVSNSQNSVSLKIAQGSLKN
jgi:hypothetical protein